MHQGFVRDLHDTGLEIGYIGVEILVLSGLGTCVSFDNHKHLEHSKIRNQCLRG